jgi:hypothetical protein
MRNILFLLVLCAMLSKFTVSAQSKKYALRTVAFYNFENLFDTIDNPNYDEEWTPKGLQRWTTAKYKQKLTNLATVIKQIGTNDQQKEAPTLVGGAEIENRNVLEDLVKHPNLVDEDYGIIHFDSPDKRGIDVALLYKKKYFKPSSFINIPLVVYRAKTKFKGKEISEDKVEQDNTEMDNCLLYTSPSPRDV